MANQLGAQIVATADATGGFSPGFAGRADLDGGRQVFIKAVSPAQNPDAPRLLRREIEATATLPTSVPAPRLVDSFEIDGWVAAVFEYVAGSMPRVPWTEPDLAETLTALAELNETPAPSCLPSAQERLAPLFTGWRQLRHNGTTGDTWIDGHLDRLVEFELAALDAIEGDRLVHNDIRADNVLIDDEGRVVFVDWAHACAGPAWLDLLLWLAPLQLEGGGAPDAVLARAPHDIPSEDVVLAVHAAATGYFLFHSTLPDPPGLPTVRAFQRSQADASLQWLRQLVD